MLKQGIAKLNKPLFQIEMYLHHSVEIQDLSVTQNLREINFGESRSCKNAVFAIFGALKIAKNH